MTLSLIIKPIKRKSITLKTVTPETEYVNNTSPKSTPPMTSKITGSSRKPANYSRSKSKSMNKTKSSTTKSSKSETAHQTTKNPCQKPISWTDHPDSELHPQSIDKMIKSQLPEKIKNSWKKYSPSKVHSLDKTWMHHTEKYDKIKNVSRLTALKIDQESSKPWLNST